MLIQLEGIGNGLDMGGYQDDAQCVRDALSLLREQEPVVATWYQVDGIFGLEDGYKCGVCNAEITPEMLYCPRCGKKVKWE